MHVGRKFEFFLERYRRRDGQKWNGQQLHDATGGVVNRSYVSMLRKGEFANPGVEKLAAIAKAMDFPPELWFREPEELEEELAGEQGRPNPEDTLAVRFRRLFESIPNDQTGAPYTDAEVARASFGDLTEEEVRGIRTGRDVNPSFNQVLALADVFGVSPAYFTERGVPAAVLDERTLKALRDQKTHAIINKSLGLTEGERDVVLNMLDSLGHLHGESGDRR